jgi:hypothetical protein
MPDSVFVIGPKYRIVVVYSENHIAQRIEVYAQDRQEAIHALMETALDYDFRSGVVHGPNGEFVASAGVGVRSGV